MFAELTIFFITVKMGNCSGNHSYNFCMANQA